jgi:hypothetical protein
VENSFLLKAKSRNFYIGGLTSTPELLLDPSVSSQGLPLGEDLNLTPGFKYNGGSSIACERPTCYLSSRSLYGRERVSASGHSAAYAARDTSNFASAK